MRIALVTGDQRSYSARALAAVAVLWACEIALARISCQPQAAIDVMESAVGLALLGWLPAVVLPAWWGRSAWLAAMLGASAGFTQALVVSQIVWPNLLPYGESVAAAVVVAMFAAIVAWRAWAGARRDTPYPGPFGTAGLVVAAAAIAWLIQYGRIAPLPVTAPLVLCCATIAWLARSPRTLALVPVVASAVALLPPLSLHPEWNNGADPAEAPDIVVLAIDTLRADDASRMSAYDRVASDGVVFTNAQAAAPWTTPAMGTLFTGVRPAVHGAARLGGRVTGALRAGVPTLAERLQAAGYDTAAIVTNGFLTSASGFDRGFDVYLQRVDLHRWSLPKSRKDRSARPVVPRILFALGLQGRPPGMDAGVVTRRALDVIEHRRTDRPLFLWLHYIDSHLPYTHADESGLPRRDAILLDNGNTNAFLSDPYWESEPGLAAMREAYRHEIAVVDGSINEVLDALGPEPERGRVVVLVSDHGEEFRERGGLGHGHSLYQELLSVPLVISGLAGREPGSRESARVGHIDIAPTLLAAAGLPVDGLAGQDLAEPVESRIYFSEDVRMRGEPVDRIAVLDGRWKLIQGPDGTARLFDLAADAAEKRSLTPLHPEVVERLLGAIPQEGSSEVVEMPLSDEDRRMLEALGYVE